MDRAILSVNHNACPLLFCVTTGSLPVLWSYAQISVLNPAEASAGPTFWLMISPDSSAYTYMVGYPA